MSDYYTKIHEDDDGIIDITIHRVPRWKESELSGDEWRFSLRGIIAYKNWIEGGHIQHVVTGRDLADIAVRVAAWCSEHRYTVLWPPFTVQELSELVVCFQPGCDAPPENVYEIKQEWTGQPHQGRRMEKRSTPVVRAFCGRHSVRGDCGLEDNDDNYDLLAFFPQVQEVGCGEG